MMRSTIAQFSLIIALSCLFFCCCGGINSLQIVPADDQQVVLGGTTVPSVPDPAAEDNWMHADSDVDQKRPPPDGTPPQGRIGQQTPNDSSTPIDRWGTPNNDDDGGGSGLTESSELDHSQAREAMVLLSTTAQTSTAARSWQGKDRLRARKR